MSVVASSGQSRGMTRPAVLSLRKLTSELLSRSWFDYV